MSVISSGVNGLKFSQTKNFVGSVDISIDFKVDLSRFGRQIEKAQNSLDESVLRDSNKFVPWRNGVLNKEGRRGFGIVEWVTPYAHYVYKGEAMAGPKYGPKYYTGKDLNISKAGNPFASKEWFEVAKIQNKHIWVRNVKRIAGGG